MYTIDLMTTLQLLREYRSTGILRAELPSGLLQFKKPCLVIIELVRGEMTACHVKDARGQTLLTDNEAYEAVSALEKLTWIFDALPEQDLPSRQQARDLPPRPAIRTSPLTTGPLQVPPARPVPQRPTNFSSSLRVPRRLMHLTHDEIYSWPRRHRQVYVLVDGIRSVEKIAAILTQPPHLIEEVLREIQLTGAIILEDR